MSVWYIITALSMSVIFLTLFVSAITAGVITTVACCAATLLLIGTPEPVPGYIAFALYLPVLIFALTLLVVRRWPMVTSVFMDYGTKRIALILHVAPTTWKISPDGDDLTHPSGITVTHYYGDDPTIWIIGGTKFNPPFGGVLLLRRMMSPIRENYLTVRKNGCFRRIDEWLQSGMPMPK